LATIKNVINTQFTSTGATKVVKDTETLGRAQTRLGQASASNARQFAAQANGLGGLVAAYAGAAATIFSVQAAFEALSKAAQAETVVRGTSALAAMTSQSGPRIIKIIQDITDSQLTVTEAAQNANIALSAGFNTQQIEQFANIAQKASRALGRDFTDSLQRIVRGVSKLEPELLDELGIFTRIEPAVQAYARQIGVAASSLNEFQRRQAFANAAIEEGNRKFSAIDTTSDSLQKTLEQLRVQISELSTGFLQIVGTALAPVISFLTNDAGNALLAFGMLLSLVFGKSTEVIGGFVTRTGTQLSGWADFIADKAKLATNEITNLQKAISKPISVDKGAGLSGIQTKARAGQDVAQAKRFADALELQRTSTNISPSQLNTINAAYKEQLAVLTKLGSQGTQSYANLNAAIVRNEKVLGKSSAQIKGFIGLSNTLRSSAALLTLGLSALGTVVNSLFAVVAIAQLIGTLFDVDLLGMVVNMFKDMSSAAKELTAGFTSLTTVAAGGGAALTKSLTIAGASEEDIAKFGDRLSGLRSQVEEAARPLKTVTAGRGVTQIRIGDPTDETRLAAVNKLIAEQQALISTGPTEGFLGIGGTSQAEIEQARLDLIGLGLILDVLRDKSEGASRVISQLAAASGLSGERVAEVLTNELKNSNEELVLLGINIEKINGTYTLENLTQDQMRLLEAVVLSRNGVDDFYASIKAGNLSAVTAGSAIAGLESKLLELNQAYEAIERREEASEANRSAATAASKAAIDAERKALEEDLAIFRQVESALNRSEKTFKDITSTFSKEISLLETAEVTGIVDAYGKIATTQMQIDLNQANYLKNVIDSTAYAKDLVGSQEKINQYIADNNLSVAEAAQLQAIIAKEAENYDKALAAVRGKLVDITKQLNSFKEKLVDQFIEISNSLKELQFDDTMAQLQFEIDMADIAYQGEQAAFEFEKAFKENQIKLIELRVDNEKLDPVKGAEQINALKEEIQGISEASIAAEKQAALEKFNMESNMRAQDNLATRERIKAEGEQLKAKFRAEYQVLKDAATVYSEISNQMGTAIVGAGNQMGQALVDAAFAAAKTFASAFSGPIGALLGVGQNIVKGSFTPQQVTSTTPTVNPAAGGFDAFLNTLGPVERALLDANNALVGFETGVDNSVTKQLELAEKAFKRQEELAVAQYELEVQAIEAKRALSEQERDILKEEAEKRLKDALDAGGGKDKEAELTKIQEMLKALFDSIKSNIQTALMALNDLIFYGEGNFGDIMSNLFKSIQQDFFKITVADPLSDFLTTSLFGALGVSKGVDNAMVYPDGALLVRIAGGVTDLLGGGAGDAAADGATQASGVFGGFFDQITNMFSNVFGSGGIVAKLFSSLFGQGGILSGLFKGLISIISSIFGGGLAQGGMVHLAQGGAAVSASLRRDRVPAMLEPGEFVLRKQSARKIGLPALQSMNATGNAGGAGNVFVNVTNEGTPKQTEASQPRFDGEKYVVDIVMRDISNNGPIRRSLRGRGGL
jgi:hypothetical protein